MRARMLILLGLSALACRTVPAELDEPSEPAAVAPLVESQGAALLPWYGDLQVEARVERAPPAEAEAKAVFEAWLGAQTKREFEAYAAVYAADFEGIKRNGAVTERLAREDWLESRRKGFERGFSITATGLELAPQKLEGAEIGAMVARFTQRWSTPSFADVGPKQLVIARRGEAAQIVHEEMLSSHVTRRKGKTTPPLLVLDIGGARYAVLGAGDPAWVDDSKPAALLDPDSVSKPLVGERVSEPMRAWIGREVEVFGAGGAPCRAKVASLEVVGRVSPSPEMDDALVEIWEQREPTEAELAASAWPMITSELFLFGKLDGCAGDLAVPVEAAELGRVIEFQPASELAPALRERALAAFRALPDYVTAQASWAADFADRAAAYGEPGGEPGAWDAREYGDVVTQLWSAGDERFVFHGVAVGASCGDWTDSLWALWRIGEGEALELVASGPEAGDFMGSSALTPTRLVRWHDALWLRTEDELYELRPKRDALLAYATAPAFFGCPC